MYNHAPENYICPFCLLVKGIESEHTYSVQSDIVYHDDSVTAFIGSGQWKNNHGNTIIVPNEHFENIYDLPIKYAQDIHRVAKLLALTMKVVYACDGVSTRQHNEPSGSQDVWHYHMLLFLVTRMMIITPRNENLCQTVNEQNTQKKSGIILRLFNYETNYA